MIHLLLIEARNSYFCVLVPFGSRHDIPCNLESWPDLFQSFPVRDFAVIISGAVVVAVIS